MTKNVRLAVVGIVSLVVVFALSSTISRYMARDKASLAPFNSEVGRFSLSLPQGVSTETDMLETKIGTLAFHTYKARSKFVQFVVAYVDYPAEYIQETGAGQLLKNAAQSAADNFGGKAIEEKAFMKDDQAVREVLIKAKKGVYARSRISIVGNRLYQVMAISTRRHVQDKKVEEVFSSLKFAPAPAEPVPPPADSAAAAN